MDVLTGSREVSSWDMVRAGRCAGREGCLVEVAFSRASADKGSEGRKKRRI